jgi:thioester reductase-like protein
MNMKKQRVFLTGATGGMGMVGLQELLKDGAYQDVVILVRDSEQNRKKLSGLPEIRT